MITTDVATHLGGMVEALAVDANGSTDVVVIQLEHRPPHDLEPVNNRLRGGERVQVRIRSHLLCWRDVLAAPVEEKLEASVDHGGE